MVAFLSHSSKDKWFVSQVAANMGPLEYEYDEHTFEYTLNVQAIRNALKRSQIFVVFLSKDSVSSSFVKEEQRQALEALGRGEIRRIAVFAIDDTSYKALPAWLREINVAHQITNPKACARRIQAMRLEVIASEGRAELYLGRDSEEADLRKALAAPADSAPIALHAVGFHGIGRRTFLRNSLARLFPRYYSVFLEITASQYQGVEDLYRSLYNLHVVSSRSDMISDFECFSTYKLADQVSIVSEMIKEMAGRGEFILVNDEAGIYDDSGNYHRHWAEILEHLRPLKRPVLGFVQVRMQPQKYRSKYPRDFHQGIGELSEGDSRELVGFSLKMADVDYTEQQLSDVVGLVDGHPYNLIFLVGFIKHYGLDNFLKDPRDFIEWKHKRGEDFLRGIEFTEAHSDIIAALAEYRYLSSDLLVHLLGGDGETLMSSVRDLQDFCCVEFRDGLFHLSAPIREATRRDRRFDRPGEWRKEIAVKICEALADYSDEDNLPIAIIESAIVASARGAAVPEFLSLLILPSHLLNIARELYDNRLRLQCIAFCKRAYEMKGRMTQDAQVETLRLWALSAARANDSAEFDRAMSLLGHYTSRIARRVRLFLEGFAFRLKGQLDDAETKYKQAWDLSPDNPHINRELAQLYCRQKRYDEAESFARQSYKIQLTNPFIIDILLETLLGKRGFHQYVDNEEIEHLKQELRRHSAEAGTSFHLIREAQECYYARDYRSANLVIQRAVSQNPNLPAVHFIDLDIQLKLGNIPGATKSLARVKGLLAGAGQSEGDEARLLEAEIDIFIEKQQYGNGVMSLKGAKHLPSRFTTRLARQLARAISFDDGNVSAEIRAWATEQLRDAS